MILDYQTIGDLYYFTCDSAKGCIDLNEYAKDISDTVNFILSSTNDPLLIEEYGRSNILFALVEILKVAHNDPNNSRFNRLTTMIPRGILLSLERTNNEVNKDLIKQGVTPKDLFIPTSRDMSIIE